jgi:hypothetical protein
VKEFHERLEWDCAKISLTRQEIVEFVFHCGIVPLYAALSNECIDRSLVQDYLEFFLPHIEDLFFHRRYGAKFVDGLDDTDGLIEAKLRGIADKFALSCVKERMCPRKQADVVIASTSSPVLEEFIEKSQLTVEFVENLTESPRVLSKNAWSIISRLDDVNTKFIEKHANSLDWNEIAKAKRVPVPRDRWGSLKSDILSRYVVLDADYIDEHTNELDWFEICEHQKLSESLLRRHIQKLNWGQVSWYQDLSETFVQDFKHMINFEKFRKRECQIINDES